MYKLSHVLLSPKRAERHPLEIIIVAFIYTTISIFLGYWIFPEHASIVMVFLTVISCLYLTQGALIVEEKREKDKYEESYILKRHGKILVFFMALFLGFLLAFTFWTLVLPENQVNHFFSTQQSAFRQIQAITGNAVKPGAFSIILTNNLRVLVLSLVMALFYGAGAIFILAWNASLMGYVIGSLVKNSLGLAALPYAFLKFFIHGIPEILAYFIGALAGGILFMAIIRGDMKKDRVKRTLVDFFVLIALSIIILVIAALLEVYISPFI